MVLARLVLLVANLAGHLLHFALIATRFFSDALSEVIFLILGLAFLFGLSPFHFLLYFFLFSFAHFHS